MKIFVPKEQRSGERRVAATPETIKKLKKLDVECHVETAAGLAAGFTDAAYLAAGAVLAESADLRSQADVVLHVAPMTAEEAATLARGALTIGFCEPHVNLDMVAGLVRGGVSSLAMELVPRITRAQGMDALSSQASIGGYKAVVLAASRLGRYFPLLMTAAGTVPPSRVVILGAGVAGLQALATAKRLGAVVEVSDIRPAVKEQVQSLGGRFIDLPEKTDAEDAGGYAKEMGEDFLARQRQILTEHLAAADVVITTAQIPGRPAPLLMTRAMVEAMHPGAVVVDMAAASGGNCELTKVDEEVDFNGVLILGPSNLPATMAHDASMLYARNVLALLEHVLDDGSLTIDPEDDVLSGALLTHNGEVLHRTTAERIKEETSSMGALLIGLYVFVLSIFVGFEIITKIPPTLHTPLMSGANAISGITIVGALHAARQGALTLSGVLGFAAIVFATINVVGGFLVTDRMLAMFGKKKS